MIVKYRSTAAFSNTPDPAGLSVLRASHEIKEQLKDQLL